jgi:hypothetical protein
MTMIRKGQYHTDSVQTDLEWLDEQAKQFGHTDAAIDSRDDDDDCQQWCNGSRLLDAAAIVPASNCPSNQLSLAYRWWMAGQSDGMAGIRGQFDGLPLCHENLTAYDDGYSWGQHLTAADNDRIKRGLVTMAEIPGDDDASVDWQEYASWDATIDNPADRAGW